MSKAILVIDMPNCCYDCDFREVNTYCEDICLCSLKRIEVNVYNKRSKYCPLREVPQKTTSWKGKSTNYQQGHRDGYNACIEEILKEGGANE